MTEKKYFQFSGVVRYALNNLKWYGTFVACFSVYMIAKSTSLSNKKSSVIKKSFVEIIACSAEIRKHNFYSILYILLGT
jgi:hypothetical protein